MTFTHDDTHYYKSDEVGTQPTGYFKRIRESGRWKYQRIGRGEFEQAYLVATAADHAAWCEQMDENASRGQGWL